MVRLSKGKIKVQYLIFWSISTHTSAPCARNLDVVIDSDLSYHQHISKVCRDSYLQIRQISRIRHSLDLKTAILLGNSLVSSRLDYCNSLFYGLPGNSLIRLQQVQNSLARVTMPPCGKFDHVDLLLVVWRFETIVDPQGSTIQTSQNEASRVSHLFINIHYTTRFRRKLEKKWRRVKMTLCYILYLGTNMQQCLAVTLQ